MSGSDAAGIPATEEGDFDELWALPAVHGDDSPDYGDSDEGDMFNLDLDDDGGDDDSSSSSSSEHGPACSDDAKL